MTRGAASWLFTATAARIRRSERKYFTLIVVQLVVDGVAAHRDERGALEGHEHRAVGLLSGGAHGDDAVVRTRCRCALADHLRLGVDRIAGENRRREAHLVPTEI